MEKNDFRDLLNITPHKEEQRKNIIKVWMKWDSNDADYIERSTSISPATLFKDKKLIYCLAYITTDYDFKGHKWNDAAFRHHITDNADIDGLCDIIGEANLGCYTDWGMCHTCYDMVLTYYDENGNAFDIDFIDIRESWKDMTYEEICEQINSIEYNTEEC